jgi:cellulose synthase/poly-beta-1,6-N-acetylglucosamine synthase-like glycosyltransferase
MRKHTTHLQSRESSRHAGPIMPLKNRKNYRSRFISVMSYDPLLFRIWTRFVAYGSLLLVFCFAYILFQPSHWLVFQQINPITKTENLIMLICLALLQLFLILGTLASTRSTLIAKDPVPVRPQNKLRIAFATTRAPGEPVALVQTTLEAATRVHYNGGVVDVWLLDETNDPELKIICYLLGVRYFSRFGAAKWNTLKSKRKLMQRTKSSDRRSSAFLAAKSKHGNFNAWLEHLNHEHISYDILAGVDTDQVPEPNYLERMLGYFRDPDVAYAVGPQVYGNFKPGLRGLVTRWAESQASFFQSTTQRAGNASTSAMFVGTNYAVRMNVLDQIGGFQPCITEDMATGLAIHASRNPNTGNHWKSVYTPDVLAIGEGPDLWSSFFTQQWRWAAGTFDTWHHMVWRVFFRLPFKVKIHYFLMLTYYPMTALTWLLGMVSSMIYLLSGSTAIVAPWGQFVSLYMMAVVMQLSLYFWNRRYNVSPHEANGSYGVSGMLASVVAAPIYLSALIGTVLGKKANFVVTTKGGATASDRISAFRIHLQWATVLLAGLYYGLTHNHHHPAMVIWALTQLAICVAPVILGMSLGLPARIRHLTKRRPQAQLVGAHHG